MNYEGPRHSPSRPRAVGGEEANPGTARGRRPPWGRGSRSLLTSLTGPSRNLVLTKEPEFPGLDCRVSVGSKPELTSG